ncbi:hypothetical protein [Pyrodictium abyssi]|uniref:Uncharacterized protein n=1 Tax=Pyrodictium abyssi TaxID=54256 RepID=A0ABN6ZQ48_9CREN|nr:hypothetical protein PABY_10910 [Pyrodictium abyssi]
MDSLRHICMGQGTSAAQPRGIAGQPLLERRGYTPSIVLAEPARKQIREGFDANETIKRLLFIEA